MPLYHCDDGSSCSSTFEADSWDEAMDTAADYMSEGEYNADEYGTQRIDYTVYQLPADMKAETGTDHHIGLDVLAGCEEQTATHVQQPTEPDCPHGSHEFVADVEHEGGLKENPGVFGHGGSVVCESHCKHCGLPRTDDSWDDKLNQHIPDGNTSYGEIPDDWPSQEDTDD